MTWTLSRFRAGDLVEVLGREEIQATLDQHGCVDGMPFMPEMLKFCGRRLRVSAVAHKTCDVARQTLQNRRLETSVHLEGTSCDGASHGGCQAECNLFWKDCWLKPVDIPGPRPAEPTPRPLSNTLDEAALQAHTRLPQAPDQVEPSYACQATRLFDATAPMAWWEPRQYWRDFRTRNHTLGHVLNVILVSTLKHLNRHAPRGYRVTRALYQMAHRRLLGRELPEFEGRIAPGERTPTGALGLKAGDRVRIKSKAEIERTLDPRGRNRGLTFDVEMVRYCGMEVTVRKSVTQLIDEATGQMRHITQPCIMFDGVVCKGDYSNCRLLCPRAIPSYFREIWLERLPTDASAAPGAAVTPDSTWESPA